jgi:hypothetical protein
VDDQLNVFLVVINAEIKFRHYFEMVHKYPPSTPLPEYMLSIMHKTINLVDLMYWRPSLREGTAGYEAWAQRQAIRQAMKDLRMASPQAPLVDVGPGKIAMIEDLTQPRSLSVQTLTRHHAQLEWPSDIKLQTQKAYFSAMMSGMPVPIPFLHIGSKLT